MIIPDDVISTDEDEGVISTDEDEGVVSTDEDEDVISTDENEGIVSTSEDEDVISIDEDVIPTREFSTKGDVVSTSEIVDEVGTIKWEKILCVIIY